MDTAAAWMLLNGRASWKERCHIIAFHRRKEPDWGADAIKAFALGEVSQRLQEEQDYLTPEALKGDDIDWHELFHRFLDASYG